MPFGLIFGAVFYGVLCLWLGLQFLVMEWGPARAIGALMIVLSVSLSLGLLLRQRWARWAGVAAAATLCYWTFQLILIRGTVEDHLLYLAALVCGILLVIPATGNVLRGAPEWRQPPRRLGRALGLTVAATVVGFIVVTPWALTAPPGTFRPAGVDWADFGPGLERARQEGKLVFVDFYASWCAPCKKMDRETFRHPEVVRMLSDEIVAVRVDSEETFPRHGYVGLDLAEEYEVENYPTVAVLDAAGRVVSRRRGYQGPEQLLEWLSEALELGDEAEPVKIVAQQ